MMSSRSVPFGIAMVGTLAVCGLLPAPLLAQDPTPCVDGVFAGDVGDYYQDLLDEHAVDPATSFFSTLSPAKQSFVANCAGKQGRDFDRYDVREVVTVGGNIIGRVYEYLDPFTTSYDPVTGLFCDAGDIGCTDGQFFYMAVVLSGCYTDNVFAAGNDPPEDQAYTESVGWGRTHAHRELRFSDKAVTNFSCEGSPGISLLPLEVDLIEPIGGSSGGGADNLDQEWIQPILSGTAPPGYAAATSSVWNITFSDWNISDNDLDGIPERTTERTWKSPFTGAGDVLVGPGCDAACQQLGYGTTWWDPIHRWEWQVVYEVRWDVSGCEPVDPDQWLLSWDENTHSSPSKEAFELCGAPDSLASLTIIKDTDVDNPWPKFAFEVQGPTPSLTSLQDWGTNECPPPALTDPTGAPLPACDNTAAWTYPDRVTFNDMIATDNPVFGGALYSIVETPAQADPVYDVSWQCKAINPSCAAAAGPGLDYLTCPADVAEVACDATPWTGAEISGVGPLTGSFSLCSGSHVICQFTNTGVSAEACVAADNAIGDLQIFGGIQTSEVSFSSATVPVTQADAPASVYLASFTPVADQSRWPGNVDSFVQPLPLVEDADGNLIPDRSAVCSGPDDTACLAWQAGEKLLAQAPVDASSDRQIGLQPTERRVTYTKDGGGGLVPREIRAFDYTASDDLLDEYDLWQGLGLTFIQGNATSENAARQLAQQMIRDTLEKKTVTIPGPQPILTYVVGDFFHAEPSLLGGPGNFRYLSADLEGNGKACDDASDPNRGYRCFFEKHRRRRKVLIAGSNDGQIHGFDAGFFTGSEVGGQLQGEFDSGTGHEIFAHITRPSLQHTADMTTMEHGPGVDGTLLLDDFFIDPFHDGTPVDTEREWRAVAIGSYREGGRGYYALDLTQPDPLEKVAVTNPAGLPDIEWVPEAGTSYVPGCSSFKSSLPSGCGSLPYPAVLWEFDDLCAGLPCDDDANSFPDLGFSWSKPNSGRMLVNVVGETDPVVKFVAIFGGGLDRANPNLVGNFLYIVDAETGKALYKRALDGAAASEPAAVDTNQDGFIDTIYIGTTAGFMYKVDVSQPADVDDATGRIVDAAQWAPFKIFDTEDRPIFFAPTVTFVAANGTYALAFGTGDRGDLWSQEDPPEAGRFFMILDQGFVEGVAPLDLGPLTEAQFQQIAKTADAASGNFLQAPLGLNQPGWVLQLDDNERVTTEALAISGLLTFSSFTPVVGPLCEYSGNGSLYALLSTNANALRLTGERTLGGIEGLAGRAVVTDQSFSVQTPEGTEDPFSTAEIQGMRQSLMGLMPANCRFANFNLNVGASLANRGQVAIAQIPVCIVPKNWKEF